MTLMPPHGKTSTVVEVKRFTIGEVAERAGVATSALRFYEEHGLIASERNAAGHRRFHADVLRRVSFIRTAQRVGLSLDEIGDALDSLPNGRTPTAKDWDRLATSWRPRLDDQIAVGRVGKVEGILVVLSQVVDDRVEQLLFFSSVFLAT